MKKYRFILIVSLFCTFAGLLVKPYSKPACASLVLGGLIVFLGILGFAVLPHMGKRCPACDQQIHVNKGQYNRVRGGMILCPRCGALVRVDHVTPR